MPTNPMALHRLFYRFDQRAALFGSTFQAAVLGGYDLSVATPPQNRMAAWYCLVGLFDTWSRFCRDLVLMSSVGGVLTLSSSLVARSPFVGVRDDPIVALEVQWRSAGLKWPRFGPSWDRQSDVLDAARVLALANSPAIQAALGNLPAIVELRACRNFLAHRHEGTANHREIVALRRRIGASAAKVDSGTLPAQRILGGLTVFEAWCTDLRIAGRLAVT